MASLVEVETAVSNDERTLAAVVEVFESRFREKFSRVSTVDISYLDLEDDLDARCFPDLPTHSSVNVQLMTDGPFGDPRFSSKHIVDPSNFDVVVALEYLVAHEYGRNSRQSAILCGQRYGADGQKYGGTWAERIVFTA